MRALLQRVSEARVVIEGRVVAEIAARLPHPVVQTGQFGADMKVHLVNDGPVTIALRMAPATL